MVPPREARLAGLEYDMNMPGGINHAPLPANLRARLEATEAASKADEGEQPLSPFLRGMSSR